jgi:hypothetical protein
MDSLLSVGLGIGLAAACGFRVFVPLLVMSVASRAGMLELAGGSEWIGSLPALVALAVATALEIAAYYVPWLDNALDTVSGPAAVVAGVVVTASAVSGMDPALRWSLAVIAGGGAAGAVKATMAVARGVSSVATAGLGNFLVASGEAAGSFLLAAAAVLVPLLALGLALLVVVVAARSLRALGRRAPAPSG